MNKVDIIMSIYDEPRDVVKRTIDNVFLQSFESIKLIICVDNPFNNDALVYLKEVQESTPEKVTFFVNKVNLGLGFSLNKCLEISTAKYIARIDADDTCDINRINKQFNYLEENPDIDALFTGYKIIKQDGSEVIPLLPLQPSMENDFFVSNPFKHGTLMVKSEVYKKYKYKLSHAPEDYEMYFRMFKGSVKFGLLNEPLYNHHKFDKVVYRKEMDTFNRHSKMVRVYLNLLLNNFTTLLYWKGYFGVLFKLIKERLIFSNYNFYSLLKKTKGLLK